VLPDWRVESTMLAYGASSSRRFFERLDAEHEESGSFPTFLSTHPSPADRIARLRETARANGWPERGDPVPFPR
jgi:predicted Zn-dependent protease